MTNIPPVALRLADEMERVAEYDHQTEAAAELRRLHAEVERLQKLCYEYLGELTAVRAAEQMRQRINELNGRNHDTR